MGGENGRGDVRVVEMKAWGTSTSHWDDNGIVLNKGWFHPSIHPNAPFHLISILSASLCDHLLTLRKVEEEIGVLLVHVIVEDTPQATAFTTVLPA